MATFAPTKAVSEILKAGGGTSEMGGRQSKDEYRKMKELEEQRKEGTAPAMVDVDTGRDINPHIPQFISQTPWYVGSSGPTLKHQRPHEERQKEMSGLADWYTRGVTNKVSTKFRKGACENCGAMTHKKKDCFERPRTLGARWTGEDIAPDEHMQPKLELGYDAKRDRWNGYDPSTHKQVVEEFQKLEETRKMVKAQTMKEEGEGEEKAAEVVEENAVDDEDKYAEDADMAGVTVDMDSRTRITVRNLRIREDTAKYLYNLDPNGPYYDPKSRSMRENPFAGVPGKEAEAVKFSGENFIRYSGEVVDANEAQVFAWQARQKGIDVHALAEPTKLEALKKEFKQQKMSFKDEQKQAIIDRYGGEEHLNAPPKELLLAQTEHYVEYSRKGKIVKGEEKPVIRSRYDEDRYHNNHTAVWGSYWKDGRWGYKCCYSVVKNSYCIGEAGRAVQDQLPALPESSLPTTAKEETNKKADDGESSPLKKKKDKKKNDEESTTSSDSSSSADSGSESDDEESKQEKEVETKKRERDEKRREKKRAKRRRQKDRKATEGAEGKKKRRNRSGDSSSTSSDSESEESGEDVTGGDKKLKAALKRAERERREAEEMIRLGDRKRKYHAKYETKAPTEEDIEAYRLTQVHSADPMANYIEEKRRKKN